MANYSDTHVSLTGSLFAVQLFRERLKIDNRYINKDISDKITIEDPDGFFTIISQIDEKINDDGSISIQIYGESRWSAPISYIAEIAYECELKGTLVDAGSECDFFHKIIVNENGIYDYIEPYFSQLSIDYYGIEYFVEEYNDFLNEADSIENVRDMLELFRNNNIDISGWVSAIRKNARNRRFK